MLLGAKRSRIAPHTPTSTNELLTRKDETLLVRGNARLVGELALHHGDGVDRFHPEGADLPGLDECVFILDVFSSCYVFHKTKKMNRSDRYILAVYFFFEFSSAPLPDGQQFGAESTAFLARKEFEINNQYSACQLSYFQHPPPGDFALAGNACAGMREEREQNGRGNAGRGSKGCAVVRAGKIRGRACGLQENGKADPHRSPGASLRCIFANTSTAQTCLHEVRTQTYEN